MLNPYYIYRHVRLDTNAVFYIGKGKNRRSRRDYERAHASNHRNRWWKRIAAKCGGYEVEIVMEFDNPDQCVAKEKELIALYGRRDLRRGTLVNLTDGGDGTWGRRVRAATRRKLSAIFSGTGHPNFGRRLSRETCRKKSASLTGINHHLYGTTLPESWKNNIRKAKRGALNPMFGKTGALHPFAKTVRNTATGATYESVAEAAQAEGVTASILYQYLDGTRRNKTDLVKV